MIICYGKYTVLQLQNVAISHFVWKALNFFWKGLDPHFVILVKWSKRTSLPETVKFCMIGFSFIERPILGDNPKAHKTDNEKRVLFVKSTCALGEKCTLFMKSAWKAYAFHGTKDHLQGIVTLCFSSFNCFKQFNRTKYEMLNHLYGFFDASVADGKGMLALYYARTATTSRRYPQSRLLHDIMSKILLVSTFIGERLERLRCGNKSVSIKVE